MVTLVVAVALDPAQEVVDLVHDPDLAPDRDLDHEAVHVTRVIANRAHDHALDHDPARLLAYSPKIITLIPVIPPQLRNMPSHIC